MLGFNSDATTLGDMNAAARRLVTLVAPVERLSREQGSAERGGGGGCRKKDRVIQRAQPI